MDHNSWADMADDIARRAFDRTSLTERVWAAAGALRVPSEQARAAIRRVADEPSRYLPVVHEQVRLLVRRSWEHGWLPHDLVRYVARQFADPLAAAVGAVVSAECRHAVETSVVHPRWESSASDAAAFVASPGRQRPPTIVMWLEALLAMRELPRLTVLAPPPGTTVAGARPAGQTSRAVDERQLERVRALLAKAESTSFPEEAESLTAKAQELIARYSLERALRDATDDEAPGPGAIRVWLDDPYPEAKSALLARIAHVNRCQTVVDRKVWCITAFGYSTDLDAVELLFTSLLAQATAAMARHGTVRDEDGTVRTRSFRRSFMLGFAHRIGERLRTAAAGAQREAEQASGGALVPVLANRQQHVESALRAAFPRTSTMRSSAVTSEHGWRAGKVAADLARLGPDISSLRAG